MINANLPVRVEDALGHGLAGDLKCGTAKFDVKAALTAGQVIGMLALPRGARIVNAIIRQEGLTGGTYSLGDAEQPGRFIDAAAAGTTIEKGALSYQLPASAVLNIKVGAAPTGTGTLYLAVEFVLDGLQKM